MIYLIGSLRNPRIPLIANQLRKYGFEVFDDWFYTGSQTDDCWRDYEKLRGRSYLEALAGKGACNAFEFDRRNIADSKGAVMVMPAGKSGHLELGIFLGSNRPGFIFFDGEPDPERYELMVKFATGIYLSMDNLVTGMRKAGL